MIKYYAVIDTNVIVSSFIKSNSVPDAIVKMALNGPIKPLMNDEILSEYTEVLTRNEFGFSKEMVENFVDELSKQAIFLDRTQTTEEFTDLKDMVFYEVVLTARNAVGAYLVTGNKKHFPIKPFVVTPREMLDIIENDIENDKDDN